MLDLRLIRQEPELIREMLEKRGEEAPLDELLELDNQRRKLISEVEQLKAKRNVVSDQIAELKRSKQDASALIEEMKVVSQTIKDYDEQLRVIDEQLLDRQLRIPNIPHESVHVGASADDNKEIRRWGEPRDFSFEPLPHWELGVDRGILDFDRAAKVTGARFYFVKGLGAALERSLINYMIDVHTSEHGYQEVLPPYIVNKHSALGTGQLPKFGEDMFKLEDLDFYLIPTAEVPVTNLYRDEIWMELNCPSITWHTRLVSVRRPGRMAVIRGVIRVHQFNKVELVKFVKPETSYAELDKLVADAETILQKLGLPTG